MFYTKIEQLNKYTTKNYIQTTLKKKYKISFLQKLKIVH